MASSACQKGTSLRDSFRVGSSPEPSWLAMGMPVWRVKLASTLLSGSASVIVTVLTGGTGFFSGGAARKAGSEPSDRKREQRRRQKARDMDRPSGTRRSGVDDRGEKRRTQGG